MEYLPDYDILRVPFFYRGDCYHNDLTQVQPNTLIPFASGLGVPIAEPQKGSFTWQIPMSVARLLEAGRALVTVTNLWSDVCDLGGLSSANFSQEQVALYCNLSQTHGYDTRNANKPMKLWQGTMSTVGSGGNEHYFLNYTAPAGIVTSQTVQTFAPIPSSISFQFSSAQVAPGSQQRPVPFMDSHGGSSYSVSVLIELAFVVPRAAKHGGVTPML